MFLRQIAADKLVRPMHYLATLRNQYHILCPLTVIMAALWNRAGHYIFALWFFLLPSFFLA